MGSALNIRYVIDADDKIAFVDDGWCQFAKDNGGENLLPPAIIGQSIWDHVTDATTSKLYKQILERVRQGQFSKFSLRCDGPECRVLVEMVITALPKDSVEFHTRPIKAENRESVPLLSRESPRSKSLLRACAWCGRVDVGIGSDDWVEVEEATSRLRLFELEKLPQLTHGMCDECSIKFKPNFS